MFNEFIHEIIKSTISICILFLLARMIGKRLISQLTFFDYIVGISIGNIASEIALSPSTDYLKGITALSIYTLFPIILSAISLRNHKARKLLNGEPMVLIEKGRILEQNLKKIKMNINDLLEECRLKDIFNLTEIEFAILETNGKMSFLLKNSSSQSQGKGKGLCTNLIIDGEIMKENLQSLNKDEKWVRTQLRRKGVNDFSDVLLAFLDDSQKIQVYLKNKLPSTVVI